MDNYNREAYIAREYGVFRTNDVIKFYRLDHPKVVSNFIKAIKYGQHNQINEFKLDFSAIKRVYPNSSVPIAGIIDFYRSNFEIIFSRTDKLQIVTATHILDPMHVDKYPELLKLNVLSRVWVFKNSAEIALLVNTFIDELSKTDEFETGVLNGLEWSLNEVMDNVLQHSNQSYGFVMGQIHKSSKHVAFCVFDNGQGIYNSLKNSIYSPRNPVDALTLCVKEGVTRDKSIGQGNGMWGLHQVIKYNKGTLMLTSSTASYIMKEDQINTFRKIPTISYANPCTIVDFQLDYDKPVSIADALKFGGRSYELVNIRLESMENNQGEILYKLIDKSSGTGTRQSGERIRNDILNIHRETGKSVIIDFEGVAVISSSFADELLGKLVIEFGFFGFNNIIRLRNMNELVQSIVQRSVSQRMAESLNN